MSTIEIKKIGITKLDTDAIVNAANEEEAKAAEEGREAVYYRTSQLTFFATPFVRDFAKTKRI